MLHRLIACYSHNCRLTSCVSIRISRLLVIPSSFFFVWIAVSSPRKLCLYFNFHCRPLWLREIDVLASDCPFARWTPALCVRECTSGSPVKSDQRKDRVEITATEPHTVKLHVVGMGLKVERWKNITKSWSKITERQVIYQPLFLLCHVDQ